MSADNSLPDTEWTSRHTIPASWCWVTLAQVADIKGGLAKGKKRRPDQSVRLVPYLRVANVQRGYLDLSQMKHIEATEEEIAELRLLDGDILFNEGGDRDKLGRGWIWSGALDECIHQNHVFRARPISSELMPKLLSMYGNTYGQAYFIGEGKQTTNLASVSLSKLSALPVPLIPVNEQRHIVAKIDSLFTRSSRARDELAHIPKLIERYRQAVLEAAFRGDLTADWRLATPARDASTLIRKIAEERGNLTNGFDSTGLPAGWHWVTLSEIADVGTGATPKRGNAKYYEGGIVPWVTSAATNNAFVDHAEQFITEAAIQETNCKVFPAGSLLLAMYGEGKTRGQVSELRISAATNQACAAIMFSGAAIPLKAHVKSWLMKLYADLREQAAGGVQPNLNLSIIRAIRVPIPPLEEQHELAARITANLSAIEAVHRQVIAAHGMLDRLDQSILDQAFTGKLVPQDPADEPAAKLLERIQAARAVAPKAKRGRRKVAP